MNQPDSILYVGGNAASIRGERVNLSGYRCFSAAYSPSRSNLKNSDPSHTSILLDSGAFTDSPEKRLGAAEALQRQQKWEKKAASLWKLDSYQVEALASYDRLIDEIWIDGKKHKRRWSITEAESAVEETVKNAEYLASLRKELFPRKLILVAQGVDYSQYLACVDRILEFATSQDIIGFGGWCILGTPFGYHWRDVFCEVIGAAAPQIAAKGLKQVHIFGCTFLPSLGKALWLLDRYNITLSVDSSRPLLEQTWGNPKKAGAKGRNWRESVAWWQNALATLRSSPYYLNPNQYKQLELNYS